ncbi:prepilin-type N-terminal cleavage/methylation domain-containing protein [Pseudomonas sp. ABC1]|uniref:type IV pilin protein n=1 Tax=Pseudomonas sp. ABC1 TaxID=2748080 RepID=UPI0015C2C299|nr:type IV pilin protein [Pseudomonas sp. ABC1]QLF92767.1 prepilin-type N-terminal cleavage/methylation domain-containing protein [Pseudomonas sp. ABC1]
MSATNRTPAAGFSLIELLVVLAIVATLVTLAYPDYRHYRLQALRSEGRSLLLELAARQEASFAHSNRYLTDETDLRHLGLAVSSHGHYQAVVNEGPGGYRLLAIPRVHDPDCGTLSLDALGSRSHSGQGDLKRCWG